MKKNDIIDLRSKTRDELARLAVDTRGEIDKMRNDEIQGKVKNTNLVRSKRKDLARILTFLSMKPLEETKTVKEQGKESPKL